MRMPANIVAMGGVCNTPIRLLSGTQYTTPFATPDLQGRDRRNGHRVDGEDGP